MTRIAFQRPSQFHPISRYYLEPDARTLRDKLYPQFIRYKLSLPISVIATRSRHYISARCRRIGAKRYGNEHEKSHDVQILARDEFDTCTARRGVTYKMVHGLNRWYVQIDLIRLDMRLSPRTGSPGVQSNEAAEVVAEINADMCKQLWIINMMRSTDSDYHLI